MADIFLSYASEDRSKAETVAHELEKEGFSVWWDRNIYSGSDFAAEIAKELKAAKAVVVLWSKLAGGSEWVRDEAAQARNDGKLVPVRLDNEGAPLGFRQRQATDLRGWKGDSEAPVFQELIASVKYVTTGEAQPIVRMSVASTSFLSTPIFKRSVIAVCMAGLALVIGVLALRQVPPSDDAGPLTTANASAVGLAVLPFVNMSSDPEQEYFADGLTEELLSWLANVEGLNVPGRTTSFQFKGRTDDMRAIAEQLGIGYLLEGSVRRDDDDLRITAQLINVETGYHLWSETYDRKFEDIFVIQGEVAESVVAELLGAIPESGAGNPAAPGDVNPHAHELYLEGRALSSRREWQAAFAKFYEATRLDPEHALAHAYAAFIAAQMASAGFQPTITSEDYATIRDQSLERAVALKPDAADVLFVQGWALHSGMQQRGQPKLDPDSRIAKRIKDFYERAVRANPRHIEALHAMIRLVPDNDERIAVYERILEIDPGYAPARSNLANSYLRAGRKSLAAEVVEETLLLFPDTPLQYLEYPMRILGMSDRLFSLYLRGLMIEPANELGRRRQIAALADLGAIDEAAFLFRQLGSEQEGVTQSNWMLSLAANLEGEAQARAELMNAIVATANAPAWVRIEYARALIAAGEPERGLELIQDARPDLREGMAPEIRIGNNAVVTDYEAFAAARAHSALGQQTRAEKIWRAARDALPKMKGPGWSGDLMEAIVYSNTGETEKAIAALQAAYDNGFRQLFSFDYGGAVEGEFYDPEGYFAPIFDAPEFMALRTMIENDNAETLAHLNQRDGFLDEIRAEMAAEAVTK